MSQAAYRVGVDTGGTFTDLVLATPDGRITHTHKLLSTPDDPARAVVRGIDELLAKAGRPPRGDEPVDVVHGSTVATNALLEHAAARVAFVTTAGFEDTLILARQNRPDLYALVPRRPDPPVPAECCVGVRERVRHDGSVETALTDVEVGRVIDVLEQLGAEAVAVSLLHSYANDAHEQQIGAAIRARFGDTMHLTLSSELLPEFREYERAATCAVNAVVAPRMGGYLGRLADEIGGDRLRIMASHGGMQPVGPVVREPIRTVLSGPAGGVLGAIALAQAPRFITFDMGGTSTDVALCHDRRFPGHPRCETTTEAESAGLPVRTPVIDIHTVGAGGGSIAWVDPGGALRVGPHSAGADPGPACYGRQHAGGGEELVATVTDAHVVVGHLPQGTMLAGGMPLDRDAAQRAVGALAQRVGLPVERTARGILEIAETTMARAVERVSLERGYDPRRFALLTFGGAGGLHACRLAERLGISKVVVPMHAGLLSAVGMLAAPTSHAFSHHAGWRVPAGPGQSLESTEQFKKQVEELERRAGLKLAEAYGTDFDKMLLQHRFQIDLRYVGQSHEIMIDLDAGDVRDAFEAEHQRLYGYAEPGRNLEVVCLRLIVSRPVGSVDLPHIEKWPEGPRTFGPDVDLHRRELCDNDRVVGPAIIREYSSTTIVPAGWSGLVYRSGRIVLKRVTAEASHG
ncbi:MAG: hydantoinase/oxoprolinase family protein [Planctomycetota bacterium]